MRDTCKTCRFWWQADEDGLGECHRHAPRPGSELTDSDRPPRAVWPITVDFDGCGEWQPATPAELELDQLVDDLDGLGDGLGWEEVKSDVVNAPVTPTTQLVLTESDRSIAELNARVAQALGTLEEE